MESVESRKARAINHEDFMIAYAKKTKNKTSTLQQANDIVQKSELERLLIPGGKPFVVTLSNDACFCTCFVSGFYFLFFIFLQYLL